MGKVQLTVRTANKAICFVERYALLVICTLSVASMFIQSVCRYVLKISTPWAEEFCIYTWQWITWIGGAYAVFSNDHLRINIMDPLLEKFRSPRVAHAVMDLVSMTILVAVCIIFWNAYHGYWLKVSPNPQVSAATRWPLTVVQVALLIGSLLMVVQGVLKWLELLCEIVLRRAEEAPQ